MTPTMKGTRPRSPCARLRWKAGVSTSCKRTYSPTSTSTALAKNGTRQPQPNNCASVRLLVINRNTPVEHKNPSGAPSCGKLPYQASFPEGPFSLAPPPTPPHSPPHPPPPPHLQT